MKKLLLALIIVASAQSLLGMEPEKEQLPPITLPQTYYQLSRNLLPELSQNILFFQFKANGIDLTKLPLKMEQSCANPSKLVEFTLQLIKLSGYETSMELFKRFFPHKKYLFVILQLYTAQHCMKLSLMTT